MRGDGRVFRRHGSAYWWIAYCHQGKELRESAKTVDRAEAETLLQQRLAAVNTPQTSQRTIYVNDVLRTFTSKVSLDWPATSLQRGYLMAIKKHLGRLAIKDINKDVVQTFIFTRQQYGRTQPQILRELHLLVEIFMAQDEADVIFIGPLTALRLCIETLMKEQASQNTAYANTATVVDKETLTAILRQQAQPVIRASGIYFLFDKEEIVYIGQSHDIATRISKHLSMKNFDSYAYIEFPIEQLNEREAWFISIFQPRDNKTFKPTADLFTRPNVGGFPHA